MKWSMYTVKVWQRGYPYSKPVVWAKFALETDAHIFSEQVRVQHPTCAVIVVYPKQ